MWDVWFDGQIVRSKIEHPWIINKISENIMISTMYMHSRFDTHIALKILMVSKSMHADFTKAKKLSIF